jgi:hypothetical protein
MRLRPLSLALRALRGQRSIHGRALPSPEEALDLLRRLTGQDFGEDAAAWGACLRDNQPAYRSGSPSPPADETG